MIFNLLQVPQLDPEAIAIQADSAKVALKEAAKVLAEDPNKFLMDLGEHAIAFGLKVLAAIAIYAVGSWLIKWVRKLLRAFFNRRGTEPTLSTFVISFTSITLTILVLVITIGTLGVNTTSFAALLAAGGMAIGMALSGTVQNFAGGLMILLFKPFKVGDCIKAQGYEGTVTEVSIVSTKIRTVANSIIVIPNGALFNGNIDNFSEKPFHRVNFDVSVAYGSDADKVRELLLGLAAADERILDGKDEGTAAPSVVLNSLANSSVDFRLVVWVKTPDYWPVTFDITERIYKALPENGIEFPFPQMDVHVKNG